MKRQAAWKAVGGGLLVCALLVHGWNARSQTGDPPPTGHFVTFDPPGSTLTFPSAITAVGVVVGSYIDSSGAQHGFLRNADGSFTTFDPPGSTLTTATAINPAGTVTGAYNDAAGVTHGFVRTADGTLTSFDAPTGFIVNSIYLAFGTPPSINPSGAIVGTYNVSVSSSAEHGFLRESNGALTTIDVPGSTFTEVLAINPAGTLTGDFCSTTACFVGFLRASDGTFITTNFPGIPVCINPAGTTAGNYVDASNVTHGFVRSPNGTVTTFDVPGAKNVINIEVFAINPAGTLTGFYATPTFFHGFLRAADGAFTTIDVPGSTGTAGAAINPAGTVTGVFFDAAGALHGFLFSGFQVIP